MLLLHLKLANFLAELRERTSRTNFVLANCDFAAASGNALLVNYVGTSNFPIFSRSSGSALRVQLLYEQLAISQPERASHTTFVLKLANSVPDLRKRAAILELWVCSLRATFAIKIAIFNPELPRTRQVKPEKGAIAKADAIRQARKTEKSDGATARALRVRREQDALAQHHSESFDTQDLRRGFAKLKTNSHSATAKALRRAQSPQNSDGTTATARRHAKSPQRVCQAQDKFARRHGLGTRQ